MIVIVIMKIAFAVIVKILSRINEIQLIDDLLALESNSQSEQFVTV